MTETCVVKKVKGNFAYIEVRKHEVCSECRSCLFGTEETLVMPALMEISCKEGDIARVEMPKKQFVATPFIFFGLPLFFFMIGLLLGRVISSYDWVMIVSGFVGAILALVLAYFFDKSIKTNKKYMPVITGVFD
ncbi:MAG: SoxR reducing system RseC family protein [Firmicutes bacterium]|nr:SoxR reducing system RseC family protein [Bacillota bacterium]